MPKRKNLSSLFFLMYSEIIFTNICYALPSNKSANKI